MTTIFPTRHSFFLWLVLMLFVPAAFSQSTVKRSYFRNTDGDIYNPQSLKGIEPIHHLADTQRIDGYIRFVHRNGKLISVFWDAINGTSIGQLRRTEIRYQTDKNGNYSEAHFYNQRGIRCLDDCVFALRYQSNKQGKISEIRQLNRDGELAHSSVTVPITQMQYNEDGTIREKAFFIADSIHITGSLAIERYSYDQKGNIIEIQYFDKQYQPTKKMDHVVMAMEYDAENRIVKEILYDKDRKIITSNHPITCYKYDQNGNIIETSYKNHLDQLHSPPHSSIARIEHVYNENNLVTESRLYSITNELLDGAAITKREYNQLGDMICYSYWNKLLQPSDEYGVHKVTYRYDDYGNIIEIAHFSAEGSLVEGYGGVAITRYEYNEKGCLLQERQLNNEGQFFTERITATDYAYDENNQLKAIIHFTGSLSSDELLPSSSVRYTYDANGYLSKTSWYDAANELLFSEYEPAELQQVNDAYGNVIMYKYLDNNGIPYNTLYNPSILQLTYNANNQEVERKEFYRADTTDYEMGDKTTRKKYDFYGNLVEVTHFNSAGELISYPGDPAITRYEYDERQNRITTAYYNEQNRLTSPFQMSDYVSSIAITRQIFDEDRNILETAYFDTLDEPTTDDHGVSIKRYKYNEFGQMYQESAFNTQDQPTYMEDHSAHMVRYTYNDLYETIKKEYFELDSQLFMIEYQEHSKIIRAEFFYKNRIVSEPKKPYAAEQYTYTENGNKSSADKFDESGKRIAHEKYTWDEYNELSSTSFWDGDGNPTINEDGYHRIDWKQQRYFDTNGKEISMVEKMKKMTASYASYTKDANGATILIQYWNKRKKPINNPRGYHSYDLLQNKFFDKRGREVFPVDIY